MNGAMMKRIFGRGAGWAAVAGLLLMCACSPSNLAGGGSRGGNPVVLGSIVGPDGAAARDVQVTLIPEGYNPLTDTLQRNSSTDTTDSLGSFSITAPDSGWYNIEARGILDGARMIRFNVKAVRDSTVVLTIDTIRRPGAIKVVLPPGSDHVNGYFYVPGTFISAWIDGAGDTLSLDSVSTGILPVLYYAQRNISGEKAVRYDIPVRSNDTTVIGNPEWSHCRQMCLNTSASGASISGDVHGFPVLIRLDSGDFDFFQAKTGGEDIRFTKSDNTPLSYEIERWDPAAELAEVWVNVDTIRGNDSMQSIVMYWGNPSAADSSNGAAVFDTASGFQGVWHLDENGSDPAIDATANHYNGTAYSMSGASPISGEIGNARAFDGASSYIAMQNTASGKLNFPEDGYFTVSAWVYADTLDHANTLDFEYRTIVAKGHQQYFLQLTSFPSNKPVWEFSNFREADKWHMSTSSATGKQWVLLTGVVQGGSQYLYCNGELVDSTTSTYQQIVSRDASDDFTIGRFFKEAGIPIFGYCYFKGKIDEVSVSSIARNSDWIKLGYMNQRNDDKLVQFK